MKQITSIQNPLVKSLALLQEKSRARRDSGTFLIEGRRELSLAVKAGYRLKSILFCPDYISQSEVAAISSDAEVIEITREVYSKLAYRDTTEGVIAVAFSKDLSLSNLRLKENPLILVAEAPEKPGNIGALLRTADAAALDAVLIADPKGDLYNPNIVRSSVGGLFTNNIATGSSTEIIDFLNQNKISIYAAALQDSQPYYQQDFTSATAIVVGTESTGLSNIWRKAAKQNIRIPMEGEIDSMNVSVAAAILLFEAKRQREWQK
ncbi:MAG: RNA methyltransferase [Flavobacterium sp.]|nr:MAG: RNA methyltransferase [Flavobacterium sp.]